MLSILLLPDSFYVLLFLIGLGIMLNKNKCICEKMRQNNKIYLKDFSISNYLKKLNEITETGLRFCMFEPACERGSI